MQESHACISENRLHTPHPGDGVLGLHPIIPEVQRNMKKEPMNTAENVLLSHPTLILKVPCRNTSEIPVNSQPPVKATS